MKNMKAIITAVLLGLFTMTLNVSFVSAGQLQKVTLRVDGLACPFCAYGLEKKLKRIDGVKKLDIKINDGLVNMYYKEGAKIDKALITKKVKEAGFTPREITTQAPVAKAEEKAKKVTMNIQGMQCENCVSRIETALKKIECVTDVTVNLKDKEATVLCSGQQKDKEKLVAAVNELGFKAKLVEVSND